MTITLAPFRSEEFELHITHDDADGFHVVASGLARALGFRQALDLTRGLPDDEKGYALVRTPGGDQQAAYVTEAGFYRALGQRQPARITDPEIRAQVERFQTWVYGTVLPTIRKTGSYAVTPQLEGAELLARAVLEAQSMLAAKDAQIAELAPRAEVADRLLDADGDLSVADAAKALTRAGIDTGATRLFAQLERMRWIYRGQSDGRWRVYQSAIETGWMSVIPQSHHHPRTGELVMDPPQPRVTPKGLQRLMDRLTPATALQSA